MYVAQKNDRIVTCFNGAKKRLQMPSYVKMRKKILKSLSDLVAFVKQISPLLTFCGNDTEGSNCHNSADFLYKNYKFNNNYKINYPH